MLRRLASLQQLPSRRRSAEERRGAATVEMAVVLPVFVTIMLGMIEFGRALMVGQLVTNAAREGARLAVINGTVNTDVSTQVKTFLQGAANVAQADVTVNITISNAAAGGQLTGATTGDMVTVAVSIPFSKVSYLTPSYLANVNLSGTSAMRHE
jgi:Flp pilus assembly protein TadG